MAGQPQPRTAQLYNLSAEASLVSARTIDVLIFVLLVPAIPVVAFWTLPWERWIAKIPNPIIGPYLLYCAFAIWHFKQPWWIVVWVGLLGIAISAWAIFDLRKARMLKRPARDKGKNLAAGTRLARCRELRLLRRPKP